MNATPDDILAAAQRADKYLRPHVRETPLVSSAWLGRNSGSSVLLKLETLQTTGSFKFRGALNKILSLSQADRERGVISASTGNHGAAVAEAALLMGFPARIFVPDTVAEPKLARMIASGAEITRVPGDPLKAERAARQHADETGSPYIPPYNDQAVVAGQATVGLEILRQCATPADAVFVPLGGGGLTAGVALAIKSAWPSAQLVACSPVNSPAMIRSIEAGEIIDVPSQPTLSDGTAGGIDAGSITFDLCRGVIDELLTVSEDEIADAMRAVIENELLLVEGSAAVAIAGYRKVEPRYPAGRSAIIILSGANVSRSTLVKVLST